MSKKNKNGNLDNASPSCKTPIKIDKPITKANIHISAKTENQKLLIQSIRDNVVTIVSGPAGSGKTKISVVCGLKEFILGKYNKLIFTRPCVEANGENLGFLPGDLNEKIRPYMYPIFDFLGEYLNQKQIEGYIKSESIVTLPLAFQRGSTFSNAFVILDECLTKDTKLKTIVNGNKINNMFFLSLEKEYKNGSDIKILSYNIDKGEHEFKKVINFFDNGKKKIKKIYFNNKRTTPIKCTESHPFATFLDGKIEWKKASDIKIGDFVLRNCENKKNNSILFNRENYDILTGFILGDASLLKNESFQKSYRLSKNHGMSQYEYMKFCMNLLNGIEVFTSKSGYTGKPLCGFRTKSMQIDNKFIDSLYKNGKKTIGNNIEKYFTDRSLALWYMDDGHIRNNKNYSSMYLHTEGFSYEENILLKNMLDKKYNIDTKIDHFFRKNKDYYYLRFNKEDSFKLFDIIKEYIPQEMDFKLPESMREYYHKEKYEISHNFNGMSISIVEKIEDGEEENVYNIEVEDNNNYFANNILVHNCQNTNVGQVHMFLTRIGANCKVVMTGDPNQSDIRGVNGLVDAMKRLDGVKGLNIVKFGRQDICRDPIVAEIEDRYYGDKANLI